MIGFLPIFYFSQIPFMIVVFSDPITGKSAGSGFITFSDCDAGKTALKELDRFDLGGKRIRVSGTVLPLFFKLKILVFRAG